MNIFSFTAHFDSEDACRLHLKQNEIKLELVVTDVATNSTIGLKAVGATNVKNVELEQLYAAAPLCKAQTFPF